MKKGYYSEIEGYNSRLDEMQATILNVKLKYLNQWNKTRQEIGRYYLDNIKNKNIILPEVKDIKNHVFHLFVVRVKNRIKFQDYLEKNKIGYGIHYPLPIHLQRAYKFLGYTRGYLPVTEKVSKEIISLPIFPELKKEELEYIVNKINKFNQK